MDFSPADLFRSTKTGSRSSLDRVNKQLSASRGTFRQKVHIGVLVATVALVAYGAIIIWSASQFKADASFSRHLLGIGIGAVLAVLVWRTDLRGISNFSTALLVIDLIGRCDMKYGPDNPFLCVDRILKENEGRYDIALVEFHANATSEKLAMGILPRRPCFRRLGHAYPCADRGRARKPQGDRLYHRSRHDRPVSFRARRAYRAVHRHVSRRSDRVFSRPRRATARCQARCSTSSAAENAYRSSGCGRNTRSAETVRRCAFPRTSVRDKKALEI